MTYDVGNPGPGLEQAQNVAFLNRLMGSQHSPHWISNGNTYIWSSFCSVTLCKSIFASEDDVKGNCMICRYWLNS
jgi:hypothetical protein